MCDQRDIGTMWAQLAQCVHNGTNGTMCAQWHKWDKVCTMGPSLDVSGCSLAFKLRTAPWTKIHGSVNYFILFNPQCGTNVGC